MVTQQETRPMTVAEFMALPNDGNRHELVRGELRVMPPPKGVHGLIENAILEVIGRYLYDTALTMGWEPREGITARYKFVGFAAGGEFGVQFTLPDDPNQIRGADAAYVPADQFASVSWDRKERYRIILPAARAACGACIRRGALSTSMTLTVPCMSCAAPTPS